MSEINYYIKVEIPNLNPKEVLPGYSSGEAFVEITVYRKIKMKFLYIFPSTSESIIGKYEVTDKPGIMNWVDKIKLNGNNRYDFENYPKLSDFIMSNNLEGCAVQLSLGREY